MEVVYFYDKDLRNCPVKEYLKQYLQNAEDKEKIVKRKQKILADIDAKINYVRQNEGRPTPPISAPLHGYSCFEIKNPKDKNTVIRILYFRYQERIVLLHVFEKPAKYDTEKVRKQVDRQNQLGERNLNIFKLNPNNYEEYK